MKFLCEGVQKLQPEQIYIQTESQTDTQTDMTENITYPQSQKSQKQHSFNNLVFQIQINGKYKFIPYSNMPCTYSSAKYSTVKVIFELSNRIDDRWLTIKIRMACDNLII